MRPHWLNGPAPGAAVETLLFCFPYAGGSAAAYHRWPELAPPHLHIHRVEYPGRGARIDERHLISIPALVNDLADQLIPMLTRPYALFGHSMGGLVAFELARLLRSRRAPQPQHLFISATLPPTDGYGRRSLAAASDAEIIQELKDLGGTPERLFEDTELMAMAVRALRADSTALATYHHRAGPPLSIPLTVFGGRSDAVVPPARLRAWQEQTAAGYRLRLLSGGHFFLNDSVADLLAAIARTASVPAGTAA